jgi:hypothetical protein
MFNTAKEAIAAGYSVEWPSGPKNTRIEEKMALPIAHILFFIPEPPGLDRDVIEAEFMYEFNGKRYAAGVFTTSSTGYNETAKPIFTALDTPKVRELSLRAIKWMATVIKRQNAKNSWFLLKLTAGGYNDPKFIEFTKATLP